MSLNVQFLLRLLGSVVTVFQSLISHGPLQGHFEGQLEKYHKEVWTSKYQR